MRWCGGFGADDRDRGPSDLLPTRLCLGHGPGGVVRRLAALGFAEAAPVIELLYGTFFFLFVCVLIVFVAVGMMIGLLRGLEWLLWRLTGRPHVLEDWLWPP